MTKKFAKRLLCIGIALMLLSMIVVSAVQTNFGKVTIKQLTIETDAGWLMDADLYIPDNATAETPAPAIITSHGNYNNKEMQDANFVELARRGYVVLNVDHPNHGNSETLIGEDTVSNIKLFTGVYPGAQLLSRLPYVDKERIGFTGHSAGGITTTVLGWDNEAEERLISSVIIIDVLLANDYSDADGNFSNEFLGSRDFALMSAAYDEFSHYVYADGVTKPVEWAPGFMERAEAQSILHFGKDPAGLETRYEDTIYREEVDGEETLRAIYRANIIHPWATISSKVTADSIEFFNESLGAPNPIDKNNQVWQWKAAFNAVGILGLGLFLVAFAILMVYTPFFGELRAEEDVKPVIVTDKKGKLWFWLSLAASAIFSTVIFLSAVTIGMRQTYTTRQPQTLGIATWACICGLFAILSMVVYYNAYGKKNGFDLVERGVKIPMKKLGKTVLLAVIVAGVTYSWVFFADYFFKADFRFWTLAFKTFQADKLAVAFPYFWLFLVFYVASSVATNCFNFNSVGGKFNGVINAVAVTFPALVLPWIQYAYFYGTDKLLFWGATDRYHMFILWLFPMVIILSSATLISRAVYKKTKNPYLAGIVNALIVTIISCANSRMYMM